MASLRVETDARGVHYHVTHLVSSYICRALADHTNLCKEIWVASEGTSFFVTDNDDESGYLYAVKAMKLASEKVGAMSVGVSTAVESRHYGAAFHYAMMAVGRALSSSLGMTPYARRPAGLPSGRAISPLQSLYRRTASY